MKGKLMLVWVRLLSSHLAFSAASVSLQVGSPHKTIDRVQVLALDPSSASVWLQKGQLSLHEIQAMRMRLLAIKAPEH